MVTLRTYNPTKTEPADLRKPFMRIGLMVLIVLGTIGYMIFRGIIPSIAGVIYLMMACALVVFLYISVKKNHPAVPVRDGELSISENGVEFKSPEENFRAKPDMIDSLELTYGGHDNKMNGHAPAGVENKIAVRFSDGKSFDRKVEIANARQKKLLKQEIDALRKAGVHKIMVRNASDSEWGKF